MPAEWSDDLIGLTDEQRVAEFEAFVHRQKPADTPWEPTAAVPYDFESRKQIEGIHPQLIKAVFHPLSVLDVGCGPYGHLVRMLRELNVEATGIDKQEVHEDTHLILRGALWRWDITNDCPGRYDLVICREVLEHLTVLELRRAVRNLVRSTRKFLYITTRFAKTPTHLLSVDGSDDLDPTHISMCSKSFIRLLFILEGCRSRPDLEARMDHQHKGRCLVFEVGA